MKKELLQQATNLAENRKRKKGWQRFVQMLALCVVFCTTYLLILPAITIQEKPICGHAEHTHTDQCSMTPRAELVNCGIPEGTLALHRHEALCFDESGALICSLPERLAHAHGEGCWTVNPLHRAHPPGPCPHGGMLPGNPDADLHPAGAWAPQPHRKLL